MPYKTQITNASESLKSNYDKIRVAINKLHSALNGTNFDKTCENVERLFKKAETEFMGNPNISIREQIDFYYELRYACVELGELKAYLTQYINLKIEDLKKKETQELTSNVIQLPDLKVDDVKRLQKVA